VIRLQARTYVRKHFIYVSRGTACCSKCGYKMLADNHSVKTHKKKCGVNFVEKLIDYRDRACVWEMEDEHLILYVYRSKAQFDSNGVVESVRWKLVYKVRFGIRNKSIEEDFFVRDENVKEMSFVSLNGETSAEIVRRYLGLPYENIATLLECYQDRYPVR